MTYLADNGVELTDELLDAMAAEYEDGSWSGVGKVSPGRPRFYGEEMETVSFRIPKSRIEAMGRAAENAGMTRSEFVRMAIDRELLALA